MESKNIIKDISKILPSAQLFFRLHEKQIAKYYCNIGSNCSTDSTKNNKATHSITRDITKQDIDILLSGIGPYPLLYNKYTEITPWLKPKRIVCPTLQIEDHKQNLIESDKKDICSIELIQFSSIGGSVEVINYFS